MVNVQANRYTTPHDELRDDTIDVLQRIKKLLEQRIRVSSVQFSVRQGHNNELCIATMKQDGCSAHIEFSMLEFESNVAYADSIAYRLVILFARERYLKPR